MGPLSKSLTDAGALILALRELDLTKTKDGMELFKVCLARINEAKTSSAFNEADQVAKVLSTKPKEIKIRSGGAKRALKSMIPVWQDLLKEEKDPFIIERLKIAIEKAERA